MKDLFGNELRQDPVYVNIYADEIQSKKCPYTNETWMYISLVFEDLKNLLIDDIYNERFLYNFDEASPFYEKNNKIIHWSEMKSADEKEICKRWFEYILDPNKSRNTFYSYILGLNDSYLIREEFDTEDEFNSKYNKFFRSSVLYAIKVFFSGRNVVVENVYHEEGQQSHSKYFPWHVIYKIEKEEKNISFNCKEVVFLPKDHKKDRRSNIIQLCDAVLGVSTSIIHGIKKSKASKYREELADLYLPLFKRLIEKPSNPRSCYEYYRRIMVRFFPKTKSNLGDIERLKNQFYTNRRLNYLEKKSGQQILNFS